MFASSKREEMFSILAYAHKEAREVERRSR